LKEKLIIKNFGPIKEVDLDLGRFTILIGEQATGKSTVAKVLAVCRYFSYIIDIGSGPIPEIMEGIEAWGLGEYIKADSYMYYECNHYSLTAKNIIETSPKYDITNEEPYEEEHFIFSSELNPLSKEFKSLLIELDKVKYNNVHKTGSMTLVSKTIIPTSFYLNDVKNVMDNPFYLPTHRGLQSIFDIGQNSIRNLSSQ